MLVRDTDVTQPNLQKCAVPNCTVVETGGKETCVAWDKRMCRPHFADYYVWSEHRVDNRAPTPDEWKAFTTWSKEERAA